MQHAKYLSQEEVLYLEDIIRRYQNRDTLMLETLLATGARASELLAIRKADLGDTAVFIRGLKGSNDRVIPLKRDLYKRLQVYAGLCLTTQDLIFNISYDRLYQIWQFYKPFDKGLHALRHTFAIALYRKSKDLRLVQRALGHKSIKNTMIYNELVYTVDEMRKAMF